ncbi:MAG: ATP-binding cassette domain-containing protein, partial [Coprococcus sp.]
MSEEKKFLSVRNLEVIYTSGKKTVQAVNKVSFDLEKGETLALVGETGAGKTTIAKSILGILPNP